MRMIYKLLVIQLIFLHVFSVSFLFGAGKKPHHSQSNAVQEEEIAGEYPAEIEEFDPDELRTVYDGSEETKKTKETENIDDEEYEEEAEEGASNAENGYEIEYIEGTDRVVTPGSEYDVEYIEVEEGEAVDGLPGVPGYQGPHTIHKVWIWQETGDTLCGIAEKYYGDASLWEVIFEANRDILDSPSKIYPKMELIIPDIEIEYVEEMEE